jgi:hypothetical protein
LWHESTKQVNDSAVLALPARAEHDGRTCLPTAARSEIDAMRIQCQRLGVSKPQWCVRLLAVRAWFNDMTGSSPSYYEEIAQVALSHRRLGARSFG